LLASAEFFPLPVSANIFKGSWALPSSLNLDTPPVESVVIEVNDSSDAALLISLCLSLFCEAISTPSEPLMINIAQRAITLAKDAYYWSTALTSSHSPDKQLGSVVTFARSAAIVASRFKMSTRVGDVVNDILLRRIREAKVWSPYDPVLIELVERAPCTSQVDQGTLNLLLTAVREEGVPRTTSLVVCRIYYSSNAQLNETTQDLVSIYVQSNIECIPIPFLQAALDVFAVCGPPPAVVERLSTIRRRLKENQGNEERLANWRSRVRADATVIVPNSKFELMEEDPPATSSLFAQYIMRNVQIHVMEQLPSLDPASRIYVCARLYNLVSVLVRGVDTGDQEKISELPLFGVLSILLAALLDFSDMGTRETPEILMPIYRTLEVILKYEDLQWEVGQTDTLLVLLERGLTTPARSVRLSAK
jgi:hypothetical protein